MPGVAHLNGAEQTDQLRSSEDASLSNRLLLFDRIGQAIWRAQRYATQVAVMVIDVDALQRVSDTLGFAVNEKFAKTIVAHIKKVLRCTDTVALTEENELLFSVSLLGRSEIVVLLTDLKQSEIVTTILQRIFSVNNEPVEVEGNEFYLNSNIGVSLYPFDGEDADTLIRNASSAMREAKQSMGRNSFRFYADDINQRSKKQIHLEAELHRAVEREELILYYQPKVDLKSGCILGMEGAAAVAASANGAGAAQRLYPAGRTDRDDRGDQPMGDRRGLPAGSPVAGSRLWCGQCGHQSIAGRVQKSATGRSNHPPGRSGGGTGQCH